MDDMLKELLAAIEEILETEDEIFSSAKDIMLHTISTSLSGAKADNDIAAIVTQNKAAGVSRSEMVKQNELLKEFVYKVITEEYKPRYLNPAKHEFLDSFASLFEDYCNTIVAFWDNDTPTIHVQRLRETAKLPTYASTGDQGADIYACEDVIIPANSFGTIVKTGIAVAIPAGWALAVRPRSGMSTKTRIRISNAPGTIDTNYKNEVGVIIDNFSDQSYEIKTGDRIAQFVLEKNYQSLFVETDDVHKHGADRGGGFGHTGV